MSAPKINHRPGLPANRNVEIRLEEVGSGNKSVLSEYISSRNESSFVDCWEWRRFTENIYGLEHFWYMAKNHGKIEGFLGLALADHPVFGRYLATAPFASHGGFHADSRDAFLSLVGKAEELQDQARARYTLIRHMNPKWDFPDGWENDFSYATYRLPPEKDFEAYFKENIKGKIRNEIKNCMKHDLRAMFGGKELIGDCWIAISRSMKELGSPYHSRRYLEELAECMGSRAIYVLSKSIDNEIVGGGLIISHRGKMEILHMNALQKYRAMHVSDFLYWSTIQECHRRNAGSIDMGRSLVDSGNERYKMKWKPVRQALHYSYRLAPNMSMPNLNQGNPRLQLAIRAWQRMPSFCADFLGPRLMPGIL